MTLKHPSFSRLVQPPGSDNKLSPKSGAWEVGQTMPRGTAAKARYVGPQRKPGCHVLRDSIHRTFWKRQGYEDRNYQKSAHFGVMKMFYILITVLVTHIYFCQNSLNCWLKKGVNSFLKNPAIPLLDIYMEKTKMVI